MCKIIYIGVMTSQGKPDNGFTAALRQVFKEVEDISIQQIKLLKSADLVFIQTQNEGITKSDFQYLKSLGAFCINWTGDKRHTTPKYCWDYAPYVDITCFSNMEDVENMRKMGFKSEFMQIGYDNALYYPDPNVQKDIDICWMGNNYGHFPLSNLRVEMVRELKRTYGDRFKAFGIGCPDGNFMGNQKGEADIYRRSKIAINLSHFDSERYTSDRMFRALGSGCCVLSHAFKGWQNDFLHGHELVIWNDIDHLKQLINECLADEKIINNISKHGHQLALNGYTFTSMARNVKELYEKR